MREPTSDFVVVQVQQPVVPERSPVLSKIEQRSQLPFTRFPTVKHGCGYLARRAETRHSLTPKQRHFVKEFIYGASPPNRPRLHLGRTRLFSPTLHSSDELNPIGVPGTVNSELSGPTAHRISSTRQPSSGSYKKGVSSSSQSSIPRNEFPKPQECASLDSRTVSTNRSGNNNSIVPSGTVENLRNIPVRKKTSKIVKNETYVQPNNNSSEQPQLISSRICISDKRRSSTASAIAGTAIVADEGADEPAVAKPLRTVQPQSQQISSVDLRNMRSAESVRSPGNLRSPENVRSSRRDQRDQREISGALQDAMAKLRNKNAIRNEARHHSSPTEAESRPTGATPTTGVTPASSGPDSVEYGRAFLDDRNQRGATVVVSFSNDPFNNALPLPPELVLEMYQQANNKAGRTLVQFHRKYSVVKFTAGMPWLSPQTHQAILQVIILQFVAWGLSAVAVICSSVAESLPKVTVPILLPLFAVLHFGGYLSFVKGWLFGIMSYCAANVIVAGFQVTLIVGAVRTLIIDAKTHVPTAPEGGIWPTTSPPPTTEMPERFNWLLATALLCAAGAAANFVLFLAAGALWLRLRSEQDEMRVVIPTMREVAVPNEMPFLRWYFGLSRTSDNGASGKSLPPANDKKSVLPEFQRTSHVDGLP